MTDAFSGEKCQFFSSYFLNGEKFGQKILGHITCDVIFQLIANILRERERREIKKQFRPHLHHKSDQKVIRASITNSMLTSEMDEGRWASVKRQN